MDKYSDDDKSSTFYNINGKNNINIKKIHCSIITCFIFFVFFLSTINNLYNYSHLRTTRYILTYANVLYMISFLSLNIQVESLIGLKNGILPINKYLKDIKKNLKTIDFFLSHYIVYFVYKFWKYVIKNRIKPKIFCKIGIILSIINFFIQKNTQTDFIRIFFSFCFFVLLFLLHISFKIVMRDFMVFQCDSLMNEFGFILLFLNLSDSYYLKYANTLVICILRLVCFKVLFNSAVYKLINNNSQWLKLEAFQTIFFCQPIPSILSYAANYIVNKKLLCFMVIVSELLCSWLIFCSSILRIVFFIIFVNVHITCYILCNNIFFSYICLILFFSSFDDSILNLFSNSLRVPHLYKNNLLTNISIYALVWIINAVTLIFYFLSIFMNFVPFFEQWNVSNFTIFHFFYHIYYYFCPLNICNSYAMLANANTYRKEIIIEELHEIGKRYEWKCVYFNYNPANINKIGSIVWWGHVPRLEWKFHFFSYNFDKKNHKKDGYPIYICSFLANLCNREKELMSMFNNEQIQKIPLMIRLTSYNYKMSINEYDKNNVLLKSLNPQDNAEWEIGKYWKRKKTGIIEILKYKENFKIKKK
ncbi:lipase maturation factor, putative [Hepatocystis sp. ex Piliocolobus tephrosceles]|nr:lipase maturation factor, putative [Hepatocystis sp. ex Piliocolobus tephrosceles]